MRVACLVWISALLLCSYLQAGENYPNSPKGFNKQYETLFKVWQKHKPDDLDSSMQGFAIPEHWFTDNFSPDVAADLRTRYQQAFEAFKLGTPKRFDPESNSALQQRYHLSKDKSYQIDTNLSAPEISGEPRSVPASLHPLTPAESYGIHLLMFMKDSYHPFISWTDSFIYVDGQFRFAGSGAHPFWEGHRLVPLTPLSSLVTRAVGSSTAANELE